MNLLIHFHVNQIPAHLIGIEERVGKGCGRGNLLSVLLVKKLLFG